jgi:peroxisomal membrane protein 4
MILLFRSGPLSSKLSSVLKATKQHARNLATFAFLYKFLMLAQKSIRPQGKELSSDSFIAGAMGGWWVFGRSRSSVNQQIVIYVAARVVLAAASLAVQPRGDNTLLGGKYGGRGGMGIVGLSDKNREMVGKHAWPVFASLSWACVMWLFRFYPDMLQPSLRSSMTYLWVLLLFLGLEEFLLICLTGTITPIIGILSGTSWCITNEEGGKEGRSSRECCIYITTLRKRPLSLLWHYHLCEISKRDQLRELLSKLFKNLFHRLHTIRHKDLKAILDNTWEAEAPATPRQPFRSLEPLHLPHLQLQKLRLANLDLATEFQDPQQTLLDASPHPSKRSNHPSQIGDTEPESLGPSEWSENPRFENQEQSNGFEQIAFDPIVCNYQDCNSNSDTDDCDNNTCMLPFT